MTNRNSCATCKWHYCDEIDNAMICVNGASDYCTEWTDDSFACDEWEGSKNG